MMGQVHTFPDPAAVAEAAATTIARALSRAIADTGIASLVLSGGTTPGETYMRLPDIHDAQNIDWHKVHLFWADERPVAPDDPESNFHLVNETLLRRVSMPEKNLHRIRAELPADQAASLYEEEIRKFFALRAGEFPHFTVCVLGLGRDGHTASLFPSSPLLEETRRIVASVFVPSLGKPRISLTLPSINSAESVVFLVTGASKAEIFRGVMEEPTGTYPAQRVHPLTGKLLWLVDADTASET